MFMFSTHFKNIHVRDGNSVLVGHMKQIMTSLIEVKRMKVPVLRHCLGVSNGRWHKDRHALITQTEL